MTYHAINMRTRKQYAENDDIAFLVASCWHTQYGIWKDWAKAEATTSSPPRFAIELQPFYPTDAIKHPCLVLKTGCWELNMIAFTDAKFSECAQAFQNRINILANHGIYLSTKPKDESDQQGYAA